MPDARRVEIDAAASALALEQPAALADAVGAFLRELRP